jgi:MoxR-like ATPase
MTHTIRRSVVLVGPQGCGKTLYAPAFAHMFGLPRWGDADTMDGLPPMNTLILTNEILPSMRKFRIVQFHDALTQLRLQSDLQ